VNRVHISRRLLGKIGLWALAGLLSLALIATGLVVWSVRRAFPQVGGELKLAGLTAPVTVYRDEHGIPQVYARTSDDLFRAQGYLHAQDRFWEMDFRRHVTAGRLSELFGKDQLDTDAYLRTMGWRRVAEQEWSLISPESQRLLQAYADGVNAWLAATGGADPTGAKSLEYTILGLTNGDYTVEQWDPVDSLAWLKAMAWDLRGNMESEIARGSLLAHGLTKEQVEQLYPAYPFDRNRTIVGDGTVKDGTFTDAAALAAPASYLRDASSTLDAVAAGLARLPELMGDGGPGIGSNSWVIAGSKTATGKPLLANDPHLSPSMPGIWYQMGLHCECDYNVAGFTFSGVPGVVIGHNSRVAWGFTNLDPDVTDLYLEKVDGNKVFDGTTWQPLTTRQEVLKVAGGQPVTITVRTSKHGPLLSDQSEELRGIQPPYALALRWTALDPGRTIDALFALNRAGNWEQFRAAASLFEVPAQNIIYADVDGNIGYQSPGRVPVRGKGDGRWPAPGWDAAYDWKGFIPFSELPTVFNPSDGYVVTANQAVIKQASDGGSYPHLLTHDWTYGYRSQRIADMINERSSGGHKITAEDIREMQFDNRNGFAPTLVPYLRNSGATGEAARADHLLEGWDYQQPAESPAKSSAAAAFYNATWRQLLLLTFDELPADRLPSGGDRWFEVMRGLLAQPTSPWWDRKDTPDVVEDRDVVVAMAEEAAAQELKEKLGDDPDDWRWGDLHQITVRNQTFGKSGIGPIEWLFNHGPAGVSGGDDIVNATGWDAGEGYEVDAVPSMRMIVDLSALDASRWVQLTGNSGHAFSTNYDDQFDLWRTGANLPMRWDRKTIELEAEETLTLAP
jgi:penicillin amidase